MSIFPKAGLLAGFVLAIAGSVSYSDMDGQPPADNAKKEQSKPRTKKQTPSSAGDKSQSKRAEEDDDQTSPAASMADDLAKSTGARHGLLLNIYRDAKGPEYTEVLALAIPKLKGDLQRKTRDALAERLTRMKDTTLKAYLRDPDLEIIVAAARASAKKGSKVLIPQIIPLLRVTRGGVSEAAHQALKDLAGQDFGPKANASSEERTQATRQWTEWWNKQGGK